MINFAVFKILKYFNSRLWLVAAKSPAIFLLMLEFVAKFVGELKYLYMIYNDTQAKAADVALAALLAAGSAMPKDSFCAAMYKVTDDHWLHNEVLNLLEGDGFIYFEGTYGWRVRLTQEGCKAASKGVLAYHKRKRLFETINQYRVVLSVVSAFVALLGLLLNWLHTAR